VVRHRIQAGRNPSERHGRVRKPFEFSRDQLPPYLHLPYKNDFIVQSDPAFLGFEPVSWEERQKTPKLVQNDYIRVWHKKDDLFGESKIHVRIQMETGFAGLDAASYCIAKLYIKLVEDDMKITLAQAVSAGLEYTQSVEEDSHSVSNDLI
jgi:secreted Zn-dependent insulinase-like peptidase